MNNFEELLLNVRRGPEFQGQIEAINTFGEQLENFRNRSVTYRTLKDHNSLEVLSLLIQSWPASDIRTSYSYEEDELLRDTTDYFMEDVAKGIELRERNRSLKYNSLVFDIMLQDNLDEFEDYNNEVDKHNYEWLGSGGYLYDFDPVTGDEERIKDTYVDTVSPSSLHHHPLKNNMSSGDLTERAPDIKRSKYGSIEFRMSLEGAVFTLGYIVTSRDGYLLCYNEITGKDLSKLVRRVTQEIWGNFQVTHYKGAFDYGISQLFKGHKIKVCKDRGNVLPDWSPTTKAKVATPYNKESDKFLILSGIFRAIIPFLLFVYGIFWVPFKVLFTGEGDYLVTSVVVSTVLIFISLKIADSFEFSGKSKSLEEKLK